MAAIPACLMCCGVSKSGSPTWTPSTWWPWLLRSATAIIVWDMAEGLLFAKWLDRCSGTAAGVVSGWATGVLRGRGGMSEGCFDEGGSLDGQAGLEVADEFVGGVGAERLEAEGASQRYPVDPRAADVHQGPGLGAWSRAHIAHLVAQDLVLVVGEHDGEDVQLLAGVGPQRLRG